MSAELAERGFERPVCCDTLAGGSRALTIWGATCRGDLVRGLRAPDFLSRLFDTVKPGDRIHVAAYDSHADRSRAIRLPLAPTARASFDLRVLSPMRDVAIMQPVGGPCGGQAKPSPVTKHAAAKSARDRAGLFLAKDISSEAA